MSDHNRSDSDAESFFLREGELVTGTRSGHTRRDHDRGLNPGRRYSDHTRVRRRFIDRVIDMKIQGMSALSIANILNDEGLKTANESLWTEDAISQLVKIEASRAKRDAWRPIHKSSNGPDHE